ncbi:putative holin-like toxin [Enterococcus mundtii]|uniref:competence inhibitor ComI n=1 Tax=Enterococcus mundtii TaxID=53346 RepID=UPI003AF0E4D2
MPVETALALMISFGSLIATIIFGILALVNNDKKNSRHFSRRLAISFCKYFS